MTVRQAVERIAERPMSDAEYIDLLEKAVEAKDEVIIPLLAVQRAARRVVVNAYGTKPRHTKARDGGCRDDCIPCGLDALKAALSSAPGGDAE